METAVDVQLLTHTPDPVRVMYVAFRTCYSRFTPQQIWADIESGKISEEKMKTFIFDKLKTGHSSPRTQVYFTFAVSGLSRSASHQLVRHNNGITFDQQSQRYYAFKEGDFPFVVPESWDAAGLRQRYLDFMRAVGELYDQALKAGVPAEDARFLLPNGATTNLTFTVNYEEFLHIADLRLCWRAQWEIRHMWARARNALKASFPELARPIQPKCGDQRMGYCDEPMAEYLKCPLGQRRVRLHKDEIVAAAKEGRTLESRPLTENELSLLTPAASAGKDSPPDGRVVDDQPVRVDGEVGAETALQALVPVDVVSSQRR
jgi:thymidylate synthase (FAD)